MTQSFSTYSALCLTKTENQNQRSEHQLNKKLFPDINNKFLFQFKFCEPTFLLFSHGLNYLGNICETHKLPHRILRLFQVIWSPSLKRLRTPEIEVKDMILEGTKSPRAVAKESRW